MIYARRPDGGKNPELGYTIDEGEPIDVETACVSCIELKIQNSEFKIRNLKFEFRNSNNLGMRIRNLKLENKKKLWICHFFQDLKKICWGGADRPIKENWTKQGIYFNPAEKLLSYGLKTEKNETKTLLMCLQAYLLKPLLFAENEKENKRYFVFLLK